MNILFIIEISEDIQLKILRRLATIILIIFFNKISYGNSLKIDKNVVKYVFAQARMIHFISKIAHCDHSIKIVNRIVESLKKKKNI